MSDLTATFWSRALSALLKGSIGTGPWSGFASVHKTDSARTEVAGSTRQAITFGAVSGSAVSNSGAISIPTGVSVPAATEVGWIGVYDAVSSGTLLAIVPMGVVSEFEAIVSAADTLSTGQTHGFVAGDRVCFDSIDGTPPTNIAVGTSYYVLASGLTTTAFKIALTSGGSAISLSATTGVGCIVRKFTPIVTNPSSLVDLGDGSLTIGA